jgi:hypothetical protein
MIENNRLIHDLQHATEVAKDLPLAEATSPEAEALLALAQAGGSGFISMGDPTPHRPVAGYSNATKPRYNVEREKKRRKIAAKSRKINRKH